MKYRFFILFLFINVALIRSQPLIHCQSPDTIFMVGHQCLLKADRSSVLDIKDVVSGEGFYPSLSERLFMGGDSSECYWMKYTTHNTTDEKIFLELMFPLIDTAIMYTVEEGQITQQQISGSFFPFSQRAFTANNIIFSIKPSEKPVTYFVRVKVTGYSSVKTRIGTYSAFIREYHHDDLIQGIFMGLIVVFLSYNLFIFFKFRDSFYLLYCLYLFCVSGYVFRHSGFIFQFIFPNTPQYNGVAMVLTGLGGLFGAIFSMRFLETRQSMPIVHRILLFLSVLYIIDLVASIIGMESLSIAVSRITMPLGALTVVTGAIMRWRQGHSTALIYLLGWLALTTGLIVYLFEDKGILPYNDWTAYALHLGLGLEATILSFAIAHRFSLMQKDKDEALQKMYDALADNKTLIDERYRILEAKVEERTSALNASSAKLQEYAQQLEKSNKELTEFAHIASHDLKAPLRGIVSFAQLFERKNKTKFDDLDLEYFNFIKTNASQSVRLIDDLLNYAKIDKNLGDPVDVDMTCSVEVAKMNLRAVIEDKNADIICDNLPIVVGHSSLFSQLLQNLIGNGLKYNKSLKPIIQIGMTQSGTNDCVFWVKDNGIGIAPQHQPKVFAMFHRLHGQTEYDGTGIGLAFCSRIVEAYGGRIWLESEVGIGSTFFFTLPKAQISTKKREREAA